MAYSTIDDIRALLPEDDLLALTDDEGMGVVNTARVGSAIVQADAEIDAHLGGRYSVPVTPAPSALKRLSVDMAVYNLYSRAVFTPPAVKTERYKNALKQLEAMAKGAVTLGVAEAPEPADMGSGAQSNKPVDSNVFSRDKLGGF